MATWAVPLQVHALVQSGQHTWFEYMYELVCSPPAFEGLLLAGEVTRLKELMSHHPEYTSPALYRELMTANSYAWRGPDGHCWYELDTWELHRRALTALLDESNADVDALRSWLPSPSALIHIASHEACFSMMSFGVSHPAILCATLYAERFK